MTYEINETHDPNLKSWVESANDPDTDFPIQNLPFCTFRRKNTQEFVRIGVPIGEMIFDVQQGYRRMLFEESFSGIPFLANFKTSLQDVNKFPLRPVWGIKKNPESFNSGSVSLPTNK